jgi:hypothetical protein
MIPAPYTCPNVKGVQSNDSYQSGVKYVKVCTESAGEIIYYDFAGIAGGHSSVKQFIPGTGTIKYLSKYGSDGPLVGHDRDGSVYHLKGAQDLNPDYWVYIGQLQGNTSISGTTPVSFSVVNKPEVNYSWSIVSGGSNIYISSASNQATVSLKPTHSGTAVLRFTVGSNCATSKSKDYSLNIQTNICLEGSYSNNGSNNINLNTVNSVAVGGISASVTCPNATSFTWQKTSGNINGWFPPGSSVAFTMTSGGSISFLVTARDGSTTLATRNVTFYNYGSFMVYPNPSSGEFKIDLNDELSFDIILTKLDSKEKSSFSNFTGKQSIDTSKLFPGEYVLKIFHDGKLINQQHVIISK